MNNLYTGIGSRETPTDVLYTMTGIAKSLYAMGWWLRSGGARGADQAFADGAGINSEIWLPFIGFNGIREGNLPAKEYFDLASTLHPVFDRLSPVAKKLHARNCGQILGVDGTNKSKFVLCWTKDGAETIEQISRDTGGTGTAIKLACINGISVFNMSTSDWKPRFHLFYLANLTPVQKSI